MKHLRTYEDSKVLVFPTYDGKILINKPSQRYFKSGINYQIIFVDEVTALTKNDRLPSEQPLTYKIQADNVIQVSVSGSLIYTDWNQDYVSWEFDKLDFMTTEEFYKRHTDSFIRLLEETIKERNNNLNKTDWFKKKLDDIIDRLTIPETGHIISAAKYNL